MKNKIENIVSPYLKKKEAAFVTVGIIKDGETDIFTYGENTIAQKVEPTNIVYEIGSISKVFTTSLLALKMEENALQLEDKLSLFFPELKSDCPIDLKHLATHTSGLPSYSLIKEIKNFFSKSTDHDPYCQFSLMEVKKMLNRNEELKKERFIYSNVGMGLLGQILANSENGNFEEAIKKQIAEPFHMPDTFIQITNEY